MLRDEMMARLRERKLELSAKLALVEEALAGLEKGYAPMERVLDDVILDLLAGQDF